MVSVKGRRDQKGGRSLDGVDYDIDLRHATTTQEADTSGQSRAQQERARKIREELEAKRRAEAASRYHRE